MFVRMSVRHVLVSASYPAYHFKTLFHIGIDEMLLLEKK